MPTLLQLLEQYNEDTARMIGQGAANSLARRRRHADEKDALVAFVQPLVEGASRADGWESHQQGGLRLERIALDHLPDVLTGGQATAEGDARNPVALLCSQARCCCQVRYCAELTERTVSEEPHQTHGSTGGT